MMPIRRTKKTSHIRILSIAAICFSLILHSYYTSRLVYAGEKPTKVYVGLGDSIAEGVGDLFFEGYVERFGKLLGPEWKAVKQGYIMDKSSDILNHGHITEAVAYSPDLMTLDIGGNDILSLVKTGDFPKQAVLDAARHTFSKNLKTILSQLTNAVDCPVLIVNLYNPVLKNDPIYDKVESAVVSINNDIYDIVADFDQCAVVDVYDFFKEHEIDYTWIIRGDVHPTSKGHQQIAKLIYNTYKDTYTSIGLKKQKDKRKQALSRSQISNDHPYLWDDVYEIYRHTPFKHEPYRIPYFWDSSSTGLHMTARTLGNGFSNTKYELSGQYSVVPGFSIKSDLSYDDDLTLMDLSSCITTRITSNMAGAINIGMHGTDIDIQYNPLYFLSISLSVGSDETTVLTNIYKTPNLSFYIKTNMSSQSNDLRYIESGIQYNLFWPYVK